MGGKDTFLPCNTRSQCLPGERRVCATHLAPHLKAPAWGMEPQTPAFRLERKKQNCLCLQMARYCFLEHPKDLSRKLLELISEFSKAVGYKINIQKSVAFLYANNQLLDREISQQRKTDAPWYLSLIQGGPKYLDRCESVKQSLFLYDLFFIASFMRTAVNLLLPTLCEEFKEGGTHGNQGECRLPGPGVRGMAGRRVKGHTFRFWDEQVFRT